MKNTAEHRRLAAHRKRQANWKQWGPYLSERAWGRTLRLFIQPKLREIVGPSDCF